MNTLRIGIPGVHPSAATLERLVAAHGNRVYNLAYRLTRSSADAEDLLQDVFFKLYRNWLHVSACANVDAWINRVVTTTAIDVIRARRVRARNAGEDALRALPAAAERPSQALERREMGQKLEEALAQLPPRQMAALILFDHEGLRAREVGDILGVSEPAVRRYVFEARRKVKEILTPYIKGNDR